MLKAFKCVHKVDSEWLVPFDACQKGNIHLCFGVLEHCIRSENMSRFIEVKVTVYHGQGNKWFVWDFLQCTGIYTSQPNVHSGTEKYFNTKISIGVFNILFKKRTSTTYQTEI